jgi:hypothetical protein
MPDSRPGWSNLETMSVSDIVYLTAGERFIR